MDRTNHERLSGQAAINVLQQLVRMLHEDPDLMSLHRSTMHR